MSSTWEQQARPGRAAGLFAALGQGARWLRARLGLDEGLWSLLEAEQDRWFLWLPVLVGAGIGIYFVLPVEPPLALAAAGLIAAIGIARAMPPSTASVLLGGALIALTLGFAAAKVRTGLVAEPTLARPIGTVLVRGWIEEVAPKGSRAWRVTMRVAELGTLGAAERPRRVRVRVPGSGAALRIGAPVRVTARLSPPSLPALPGDYDFARRAWFHGLGAVGYARRAPELDNSLGPAPLRIALWAPVENMRRAVAERIGAVLAGDRGAIAVALIQGDQGGISERAMATMRDSGLAHVLSISGLHMAIMAGALFWLVRAGLALSPALAQAWPVREIAAVAAGTGALFYLLLSGAQVPAVRSFIMIALMLLAVLAGRPALSLRNVALAALVLLLARPENVHDVSFLMSFAATVGLVALYEHLGERRRNETDPPEPRGLIGMVWAVLAADLLTTLIAGLAIAPLGAYFFHKYQQYSVLANLVAMPIIAFWLMPLVLVSLVAMALGLEALPLMAMGLGIDALLAIGAWVASLPGAVTRIPAMPAAAVMSMMLGAAWIALWRLPWRWLGLVPFGLGLALMGARKPPDILVGRDGQAVAIRLESGRLSALPGRGVAFELQRWLEHDGDARGLKEAGAGQGFRCDALGCTASVKGRQLAVVAHPAALADDCARALIVIVRFPRPRGCGRPQLVIDLSKVRAEGVHLIWLEEDRIGVATVAGHRGVRPWTGARPALQRRRPLERPAIEAAGPLRPQVPRAGEHGRPGFEGDHAPPDEPEVEEP